MIPVLSLIFALSTTLLEAPEELHGVPPVSYIYQYQNQYQQQYQPSSPEEPDFSWKTNDFSDEGVSVNYRIEGVRSSDTIVRRLGECEELLFRAYMSLPYEQRSQLTYLRILWTKNSGRGLGGESAIYIKCNDISSSELASVFVHEMGHITDTGLFEGRSSAGASRFIDNRKKVFSDDPSVAFYSVSWKDSKTMWKGNSSLDFVSGYAMSDPFEDFAESYNFYLLHGSQFKYLSSFNARLARKYAYIRDVIFHGEEFENNSLKLNAKKRSYDSTLLPFSLEKFLNFY